jgi:hypothetical protein
MTLYRLNKRIEAAVQILHERRTVLGPYYEVAKNLQCQGVTLHGKDYENDSPVDLEAFYRTLRFNRKKTA